MKKLSIFAILLTMATGLNAQTPLDWHMQSFGPDSLWGAGINKAIQRLDGVKVKHRPVVAVISRGFDYEHEDLQDALWTNKKEIPGNGIDDDGNGYVVTSTYGGAQGKITMIVGVDSDLICTGISITKHSETSGLGSVAVEKMPQQLLDAQSVNVDGVFHVTQAVLPHLLRAGYGRIVNLTSIAGEAGLPGYADYATAKAGMIMLTKTLAMENAKKGITVNCISPGMVAVAEPIPEPGTWVGRKGTADEMARAIVFLAADESGFITGADLPVEGGRILGPHNCDM